MLRISSLVVLTATVLSACETTACKTKLAPTANADLQVTAASVRYLSDIDHLVFSITVAGTAGGTSVTKRGSVDGAPVLGYVFPTTLSAADVGFAATEGIVALAATQHPDFDDSPIWDENLDGNYDNDGATWHTHWVVLTKDERVPGGLAVKERKPTERLPPTAPAMPMFMDSPGFPVVINGKDVRIAVPAPRVNRRIDFRFDAVAAYMAVSAPGGEHKGPAALPMLGVYQVYSVLSGNLSLPYSVTR